MKERVLIIDGNSFCYRAFYAIRHLTTSKGQPTNAIYGFITMLNKLLSELKPQYLAVAFDLKGPTFRHQRFKEYKIKRKPMPDELSVQIPIIKEVLAAYQVPIFEKAGYEADDVIATLVDKLVSSNGQKGKPELEILIVTGDKDILQLVNDAVKIINPQKDDLILDKIWVKQRYGVEPEKIIEIMALAGDATDNIPGVPGIGEATAIELIKHFGSLEGVLANLDKTGKKTCAARIKEYAQDAQMSRELARLDRDVPELVKKDTPGLLDQLKLGRVNKERLFTIFKELEFKSLMQDVAEKFQGEFHYQFISQPGEAEECLKKIAKETRLAIYICADRPEPMLAKILGVALAWAKEKTLFFPLSELSPQMFKPILENKNIQKLGHNLKYAKVVLSNYGINLQGLSFDTMLAAYLLEPAKLKYTLADLAVEYLNCKLEEAQPENRKDQAQLFCQYANVIFKLSGILEGQLRQGELLTLFAQIEMPLIEVLAEMEREGVALDKDLLLHLASDFEHKLASLTKDIYEMAGTSFNINSPKQLSLILFEQLKLPKIKRTKTGSSTDTEVLQKLAALHPLASSLLEFREISKLNSTYAEAMAKLVHPQTGRIHTSFNQTATATGRLSSSQPNLQNIPIKTALGKKIRQVFIPAEKGNLLLSADYSQIELRILAHLSEDRNLLSAFKEDLDIHLYTAALIFGVSTDKVSAQMRDSAKTVNFGIIYGMSAYGLAKDLGIGQNQAQEFIDAYFQRYPGVKDYLERQIEQAQRQGFVTTLMKRRRYIPEINSPDENTKRFAQRVAINAPVQGSASDLIKAAMVEIHHSLKAQGKTAKMIIQVHDELVFSLSPAELETVPKLIKDKMENVFKLKAPIKVSLKIGPNWLDLK